jgi:hypothetical protein
MAENVVAHEEEDEHFSAGIDAGEWGTEAGAIAVGTWELGAASVRFARGAFSMEFITEGVSAGIREWAIGAEVELAPRFVKPPTVAPVEAVSPTTAELFQDMSVSGSYPVRVGGKHHLMPRALGNRLPYGHKALTDLKSFKHSVLQGELDVHLRGITKTLDDGTSVDMLPRRGNPGRAVRRNFTLEERIKAVDDFFRGFADGRFYPAFRMELNAARKAGKLE